MLPQSVRTRACVCYDRWVDIVIKKHNDRINLSYNIPKAAENHALKPAKEVKLCCEAGLDGGISCAYIEPHNEDDQKTGQGIVPVHQQHDQQLGNRLDKILLNLNSRHKM